MASSNLAPDNHPRPAVPLHFVPPSLLRVRGFLFEYGMPIVPWAPASEVLDQFTSGMGLDSKCANQLKDAGANSVSVSIDGLQPSHDAQRGVARAYDRAMQAIAALRAARIAVGVTTQVNRMSLPELESLGDELLEAGAIGWQLQPTLPMGRAAGSSLILREEDMPEVLGTLRRLARRTKLRPIITDAFGWWTTDDASLRSADGAMPRCWLGCFAGIRHLGITCRGDVKGCLILPTEFVEANLRQVPLRQIWEDPSRFAYNRQYSRESLSGPCATCKNAELCRGGCTACSLIFHGKTGVNTRCLAIIEEPHVSDPCHD